jgi:hypothetical protein
MTIHLLPSHSPHIKRTADPSASLDGMTKGRGTPPFGVMVVMTASQTSFIHSLNLAKASQIAMEVSDQRVSLMPTRRFMFRQTLDHALEVFRRRPLETHFQKHVLAIVELYAHPVILLRL